MFWMDLTIISFCLWGGVSGYLCGWKKAGVKLAATAVTFLTASLLLRDIKCFINLHYPVEDAIRVLIYNRAAVPVGGFFSLQNVTLNSFVLPDIIRQAIIYKTAYAVTPAVYSPEDYLTLVMSNALSFLTAVLLCWGVFQLAGSLSPMHRRQLKIHEHLGGLITGILRQTLIVFIIVGSVTPYLWLFAVPKEILDLQQTVLLRWLLQLFHLTGIWWR
jgi:uncharacterized membrane protein required for colicin V production